MEGECIFTVDGVNYKAIFYYGYNNHYYATIYNDDTGAYLGQINDITQGESSTQKRLNNFVQSL